MSDVDLLVSRIRKRGWAVVSVTLNESQQKYLLHMRQPGRVENLQELQTELDLFADEHHGEYDGWQVPGQTEHL